MRINEDLMVRQVGSKYMLLELQSGQVDMASVITLNATAAFLFDALHEKDFAKEDVSALLQQEYQIDKELAAADADKFIAMLAEAHLLIEL